MKSAVSVLFLLALASFAIASDCISCEEMAGRPQAKVLTVNDDVAHTLDIYVYYDNISAPISRVPINNTIIIVDLSNSTGLHETFRTYTNDNGTAHFDFTAWKNGCVTFKVLYCPFCNPESPECGFAACMNFSFIQTDADSADDLPEGPGHYPAPSVYNSERYLPALDQLSYCAPPPAMGATPALCLPLLIIFSLLSGALYLTGRNPWAGFNIGGGRVGKHIRYQARGRGFSLDLKSAIMSIASAAKEMQTNPDTGKKYGEEAKPRYFLVSSIKDLGATIAGGEAVGQGAEQVGQGQRTAGARGGQRPGIVGAFRQAARDARVARVRSAGARVDAQGRPVGAGGGQAAGRGNTNKEFARQWGIDLGLGLARAALSVIDSTWIMQMSGVSLGGKLNEACSKSERDTSARAIADAELVADRFGRQIQAGSARIRDGGTEDTDGSRTGRRGAHFIELNTEGMGLPAGAQAAATVVEGEGGQFSITVHIREGTGTEARLTNYTMENGVVVGVERVANPGGTGGPQVGYNYSIAADGTLRATGITTYTNPPAAEGQPAGPTQVGFQAVHRDDQGRVTEVGNVVIQRDAQGGITGMFDRSQPPTQSGQPGAQIASDSSQYQTVNNLLANDNHNISSMSGITAMNAANMQQLINGTMQQANASLERTSQVYMEQYGQVEVTDRNLLGVSGEGERDSSGRIKSDTRGDYTIRVIDPTYTPSGEASSITGLAAGTVITVRNDEYTSVTNASGRDLLVRDQPITVGPGGETRYQTSIAGTNVVLDTNNRSGAPIDAGAVREHMEAFVPMLNQAVQSYQQYQALVQTEAGRQIRESRPEIAAGLDTYIAEHSRGSATFETTLRDRGVDADVAHAAGLLMGGTSLGYMDVTYASEASRGKQEFDAAVARAQTTGDRTFDQADLDALSPRARAYYDAATGLAALSPPGSPPPSFEAIERVMRPTISTLQDQEHAALVLANSTDPAQRAQGEQQLRDLHMVPPDYHPPPGTSLVDVAIHSTLGHGENATAGVVGDRVRGNTGDVMLSHPELIIPGTDAPHCDPVQRTVAQAYMAIGTDLATLPESEIRARVEQRIRTDPSIPPDGRDAALRLADSYLPRAQEVGRDFVAAQDTTVREVTARPWEYIRADADAGFQRMIADPWIRERPEMATPDQRTGFMADAARFEPFRSLTPESTQEERDRALGLFAASYAADYNRREGDAAPGGSNPLAFNPHTAYLATVASGLSDPNMAGISQIASRGGIHGGDLSAPDYQPRSVTFDPMAIAGYTAGTRTIMGAAETYGYQVPAEVYNDAREATYHLNRGEQSDAVQHYERAARLAREYDENPRMQGYEQERTATRDATGWDMGAYADRGRRRRREGESDSGGSDSGGSA